MLVHTDRFPRWLSGKESVWQCRGCEFNPQVRKISWRRKRKPTPALFTGKFHGKRSMKCYSPWVSEVRHDWAHVRTHTCIFMFSRHALSYFPCSPGASIESSLMIGIFWLEKIMKQAHLTDLGSLQAAIWHDQCRQGVNNELQINNGK